MQKAILTMQSKGQLMIPKSWRDELGTEVYQAMKDGDIIILKPIPVESDEEVLKSAKKIMKKNGALLRSLADK